MPFTGLTEDAYRFLWEIAFQNERDFFEENRARYEREIKRPMQMLAEELTDAALDIDAEFVTRPAAVVSRIRRDTRFSRDKSLYRDHVFLSYKHSGMRTGESFVMYVEFEKDAYGYGAGMYCPQPQYMAELRQRIITRPTLFLSLVENPAFSSLFELRGEEFKRSKFAAAPAALQPWLNQKRISFCHSSKDIGKTMQASIVDEIKEGFLLLKPVYRFLQGID